jgi:hypothetical protein
MDIISEGIPARAAVDQTLGGQIAPFERRGGASIEYSQRFFRKILFTSPYGDEHSVHGFESFDSERPSDYGFFGEEESDVKSIAVRNDLGDIGAYNPSALEMEMLEAVSQMSKPD